jgi:hypothetical protein
MKKLLSAAVLLIPAQSAFAKDGITYVSGNAPRVRYVVVQPCDCQTKISYGFGDGQRFGSGYGWGTGHGFGTGYGFGAGFGFNGGTAGGYQRW